MEKEQELLLKQIENILKSCDNNTVRVQFTITSEGIDTKIQNRSPESLKNDNITMRNIYGCWVL